MSNITDKEKKALKIMQKENFRNVTKDNIMQFMSILDKVDPEVAKEMIAHITEAVMRIIEADRNYSDILKRAMESIETTTSSCFESEDEIIKTSKRKLIKKEHHLKKRNFILNKWKKLLKERKTRIQSINNSYWSWLNTEAVLLCWWRGLQPVCF